MPLAQEPLGHRQLADGPPALLELVDLFPGITEDLDHAPHGLEVAEREDAAARLTRYKVQAVLEHQLPEDSGAHGGAPLHRAGLLLGGVALVEELRRVHARHPSGVDVGQMGDISRNQEVGAARSLGLQKTDEVAHVGHDVSVERGIDPSRKLATRKATSHDQLSGRASEDALAIEADRRGDLITMLIAVEHQRFFHHHGPHEEHIRGDLVERGHAHDALARRTPDGLDEAGQADALSGSGDLVSCFGVPAACHRDVGRLLDKCRHIRRRDVAVQDTLVSALLNPCRIVPEGSSRHEVSPVGEAFAQAVRDDTPPLVDHISDGGYAALRDVVVEAVVVVVHPDDLPVLEVEETRAEAPEVLELTTAARQHNGVHATSQQRDHAPWDIPAVRPVIIQLELGAAAVRPQNGVAVYDVEVSHGVLLQQKIGCRCGVYGCSLRSAVHDVFISRKSYKLKALRSGELLVCHDDVYL